MLLALFVYACGDRPAGQAVSEDSADTVEMHQTTTSPQRPRAEVAMARLPLDSFPEVPAAVRAAMRVFNCQVPQAWPDPRPHNVISGNFAGPGQIDWAVLCSARDTTSIVVVWGGPAKCQSTLAREADAHYGQIIGDKLIGYSRAIGTANIEYIIDHAKAYNGPLPPAQDHDGINDAYVEKASVVYFCHNGEWVQLQGAD